MNGLGVYWDNDQIGRLELVDERSRAYLFRYTNAPRAISISLPLDRETFSPSESRPFFEALLPEGVLRERVATELRLAASDSFGLLAALGADCAGALQILATRELAREPSVRWLTSRQLSARIEELPRHPLGVRSDDSHLRLSLAGVQNKAVLIRGGDGNYGEPLDGMPSTHILKPEVADGDFAHLPVNEYFCMRLAARSGVTVAGVELADVAGRPCLVVERFDREQLSWPPIRVHQEDLCQALGLTPDFKYQHAGWRVPSFRALADLLNEHSPYPGLDRLAGARAAVFNFLIGNADAHAKNIALLHVREGVRLAPLYDLVSTACYPDLSTTLAMSVGDELNPDAITSMHWSDLANDFDLNATAFERARLELASTIMAEAVRLRDAALVDGWHRPLLDRIVDVIATRRRRL